ncbi:MAG: alanine racemase, partial [bacterium]
LRPVMRLKSRVVRVTHVSAGTAVGYGATFRARTQTTIATVACGYADGYPRLAGAKGEVIIRDRRHPIVGRVSMDYLTVDVANADVSVDDEVELFGERISVDEVASKAQTISYEVLTGIGPRVARIYR